MHVRIFSRARLRRLSVRPRVNNLAYKFIYFRSRFRVSRYLVSLIVNVVTISFFRCVIRLPFISLSPTHTLYFLNLSETSLSDVFLFFFFCFDTHGFWHSLERGRAHKRIAPGRLSFYLSRDNSLLNWFNWIGRKITTRTTPTRDETKVYTSIPVSFIYFSFFF